MKNYEYLLFKKSYTNSSIINFCGRKGIRVDRVLVCELLDNQALANKCLRISYSYAYSQSRRKQREVFHADFKLDVAKPGQARVIWIHKDEQEMINQQKQYSMSLELEDILRRPYVQPITQVCMRDTIEIAVTLFSMQGQVDISSVQWLDCTVTFPPKYNVITYDKDLGMREDSDKA
jgi:hypothetical protein